MASEIYFTDGEREFYAAVQRQGKSSCQELIARLNVLPLEFWRSMLAFHLLGIVEFEAGKAPANLSNEIAALLELNRRLQLTTGDGPELLGLSAAASAAAVEKAREEFLARFAPERFGSAAAPEIKKIARAVCQRLQAVEAVPPKPPPAPPPPVPKPRPEAVEMPPIQTEWIIELEPPADPVFVYEARKPEGKTPAEPEKPEAEFELSAEFEVKPGTPSEPEVIYEAREPMDESPAGSENPDAAFELAAEFAIDAEPPAEPEKVYESREPVEEPPAPIAAPPPAAPAAAPSSIRMANADHEMAWELLRQCRGLYEKHDFASAVPLLKKAIRLQSGQGDFYYLLGLCESKVKVLENEAEIHLKKAIELKSWSADPVYALGALYRGQGKMKLAERCFQRVKEISYEHTGASRALVDLRRLRTPKKKK
jgi:tetratricopeptide (TPR) repeat protein